jgi:hypothetical protein
MAEWTGIRRTLNSIGPREIPPVEPVIDHSPPAPPAPGATSSPQMPGETPDDPDLPGRRRGVLPPLPSNRRPLTEYGTAQRLLRLFTPPPGADLAASDWEQGPTTFEERRKADPALLTPFRPLEGYGLGIGRRAPAIAAAEEFEAIAGADEPVPAPPTVAHPAEAAPPVAAVVDAPPPMALTDIPAGAVLGDGTANCPPAYPVKGNAQSKIFHTAASRVYEQTIPEICFATPQDAEAAGFRPPKNL